MNKNINHFLHKKKIYLKYVDDSHFKYTYKLYYQGDNKFKVNYHCFEFEVHQRMNDGILLANSNEVIKHIKEYRKDNIKIFKQLLKLFPEYLI